MILSFSHVSFQQSHMFCLAMEQAMSQSTTFCAGNAAMCFLPYVLRSGRTRTAVRSSEGYVLRSQGDSAEMAIDGKVDEKMENVGFVLTVGIPGLRRVLRP